MNLTKSSRDALANINGLVSPDPAEAVWRKTLKAHKRLEADLVAAFDMIDANIRDLKQFDELDHLVISEGLLDFFESKVRGLRDTASSFYSSIICYSMEYTERATGRPHPQSKRKSIHDTTGDEVTSLSGKRLWVSSFALEDANECNQKRIADDTALYEACVTLLIMEIKRQGAIYEEEAALQIVARVDERMRLFNAKMMHYYKMQKDALDLIYRDFPETRKPQRQRQ